MRCRDFGVGSAFFVFAFMIGSSPAQEGPRLKTTWKERDVRVEAFSPDGRTLVSSGREGKHLRDAATGAIRADLGTPRWGAATKTAFTPDSRLLFAQIMTERSLPLVAHDVVAWDVDSGQVRGAFPYVAAHLDEGSFALSADGRHLACIDNSAKLPVQAETAKFKIGSGGVAFDAEITSNVNPGLPRVKIWHIPNWKEIATVDGGLPLAFSPDGRMLATGDRDWNKPVARVWDVGNGQLRSVLNDRSPGVWPMSFSPDGRCLVSGEGGNQSLWDVATGRRWAVDPKGRATSLAEPGFSTDGKLLFPHGLPWVNPSVMQGDEAECFDLSRLPPRRLDLGGGELILSPDGRRYVSFAGERGGADPQVATIRDLPSLQASVRFEVDRLVGGGFSPQGRWLALMGYRDEAAPPGQEAKSICEIRLINPATGKVRFVIDARERVWGNYGWKFSPDEKLLAFYYRTGSNLFVDGEPDPSDRPMMVDIWELPTP